MIKNWIKRWAALTILGMAAVTANAQPVPGLKLWYDKPAKEWVEALPVGNGHIAAMVFGNPYRERIQINEGTFWSGGPSSNENPLALESVPKIQQLIFEGKYKEASDLAQQTMIAPNKRHCAYYQTLGSIYLSFPGHENFSGFYRDLDLENAIASTKYKVDRVVFSREVFTSFTDNVLMVTLKADKPGKLTFAISMDSPLGISVSTPEADVFEASSNAWAFADIKGQLRSNTLVKVVNSGGNVSANGISVHVKEADEVTLYVTMATNFVSYLDVSGNEKEKASGNLEKALAKTPEELKKEHVDFYHELFNRVQLDLGVTDSMNKPTDKRIEEFARANDPHLAMLYFQFGRYLLISGSQPGGQPLALQGLWNQDGYPAWGGKYTVNINTEMNYWPAEMTNLPETAEPLVQMLKELSLTGQKTAKTMYGAPGWVLHHNTDLWRNTGAVDGVFWGLWPMGGSWLVQHLWYKYLYGGNREYLETIYPVIKGCAEFFQHTLIEEPEHKWLVVSPSNSPENNPQINPGVSIAAGPAMSNQLVYDLFDITIRSANILGKDKKLVADLKEKMKRIPPHLVGQHGQLQEWLKDWDSPDDKHRHISHLYALHPSNQISPYRTPELAQAVKTSLVHRGDPSTGWSMNWKINCWARLLDGNHAYKLMQEQIQLVPAVQPKGFSQSGGTYANMFDAHPPFQIDGNFGFTSGLTEMLVQSHDGVLHILAALPENWPSGSVSGLRARGGFVIEKLVWENGKISELTIKSEMGGNCRIRSYGPLVLQNDRGLKTASGKNPNPFYYVPEQANPVISDKADIKDYPTRTVFEYDVSTKKGNTYVMKAKEQ
jgi:alpha-L-fucosidase 2